MLTLADRELLRADFRAELQDHRDLDAHAEAQTREIGRLRGALARIVAEADGDHSTATVASLAEIARKAMEQL